MKSILFLNRVYPPATGATGQLLAELAPALADAAWHVTVVTGRPDKGVPRSEVIDGVRVERVSGLPFTRASHWKRAVAYLTLYPLLLWRALWLPRTDVVVTMTDPPLQLLLGPVLKLFKRCRLVHWAQDVYPELAEEIGVLRKGGALAGALRALSNWALRRHDRVIAVGRCMKARLVHRGLEPESIEVVPNWGHTPVPERAAEGRARHPVRAGELAASNERRARSDAPCLVRDDCAPEENSFRREHRLHGRFVVMYSGNLGLAHPFEAILDAAEQLQPLFPQALFLFVGDGPRLPWVKEEAARCKLGNVRFLPFQPMERLHESLAAADLHLATMSEHLFGLVVPSKVYGVLAAGRPCVFLGPAQCEAARFILEHGCGSVLSAPDGATLAGCLVKWIKDPASLRTATRRVEAVAEQVRLGEALASFERLLGKLVEKSAPARVEPAQAAPMAVRAEPAGIARRAQRF